LAPWVPVAPVKLPGNGIPRHPLFRAQRPPRTSAVPPPRPRRTPAMSKPSLSELPLYDVPAASLDLSGMPPLTPLASLQPAGSLAPGALPLLVQMPDGQTRQVALPPSATVGDLRVELNAPEDWVLGFNGEALDSGEQLGRYNIPDAYDHAGGLLKMIDTSELALGEKVDALNKACAVVRGISRGERDMDRIISAALGDEPAGATPDAGPGASQPSLRALRSARSAAVGDTSGPGASTGGLPNLSFSSLLPPWGSQGAATGAPPTPSQLIRRLGSTFPNLYPPKAADKMMADLTRQQEAQVQAQAQAQAPVPMGAAGRLAAQAQRELEKAAGGAGKDGAPAASGGAAGPAQDAGSGAMKRTGTWFEDVMRSLVPTGLEAATGSTAGGRGSGPVGDGGGGSDKDDMGGSSGEEENGAHEDEEVDDGRGGSDGESEATAGGGEKAGDGVGGGSGTDGDACGSGEERSGRRRGGGTDSGATGGGTAKVPKKRGRKRKNPELSEDQRKALRQAQNRESAKQSRLRRKTIAAEYEQRVTTLSSENETLRDTISALSDRLQFLQGLLTVSVTQRPPAAGAGPAPPIPSPATLAHQPLMTMPMIGGIVPAAPGEPNAASGTVPAFAPSGQGYGLGMPPLL
jgi:hypothetical protein